LRGWSIPARQFAAFLAAGYNRNPAHVVQTYHRTKSFTGGKCALPEQDVCAHSKLDRRILKKEYGITDLAPACTLY